MLGDYYNYLSSGDIGGIRSLFGSFPALNTPMAGAIDGDRALSKFVADEHQWLKQNALTSSVINVLATEKTEIVEILLEGKTAVGKSFELPVLLFGLHSGDRFGKINIYHSTWPVTGRHQSRPPIVWPIGRPRGPSIVERYFAALREGHKEAILETLSADAYLREPSGSAYLHQGQKHLSQFYGSVFAQPGGVPLTHCSFTECGQTCVVEYICDRWGQALFAPAAGCAVYQLSADSATIEAVRIYDDVTPPAH